MHLDTEEGHYKTRRTPVLPWLDPEASETLHPAHCVRSLAGGMFPGAESVFQFSFWVCDGYSVISGLRQLY